MPSSLNLSQSLKQNQKTILYVVLVLVVLGALYMIATMNSNSTITDTFANESDVKWDGSEMVVVFHKMSGCGYCDDFAPAWTAVVEKLDGKSVNGKTVKMVTVDDSSHPLGKGISGYPTICHYTDLDSNTRTTYGERTVGNVPQNTKTLTAWINGGCPNQKDR